VEVEVPIDLPTASAQEAAQSLCEPQIDLGPEGTHAGNCEHSEPLAGAVAQLHVDCGCNSADAPGTLSQSSASAMRFAHAAASHSARARAALASTRHAARTMLAHKAAQAVAALGQGDLEGDQGGSDLPADGRKCHCEVAYTAGKDEEDGSGKGSGAAHSLRPVLRCQCLLPADVAS